MGHPDLRGLRGHFHASTAKQQGSNKGHRETIQYEAYANGVVKRNSTGKNLLRIGFAALKARASLANRLTGDHH